jgi:glycosyltransferase involved in cell wall biosynthesis
MENNPGPRLCSKVFNIALYMEINDLIVPVLIESKAHPVIISKVAQNQKLDFNQAAGLIVPSVPMVNWIIDQYDLPESKVHMILNGTEKSNDYKLDKSRARKEIGFNESCFCLVFIGNIYKEYDFTTMLKAVAECKAKIPMIRLLIIGDGPLTYQLKRQAKKLGISDKIIFTGYIPHEKLDRIVPAADAGLLIRTMRGTERYGPVSTKLSTYACFNMPVITAGLSLKGYPDELAQGLLLVPPEDPLALADLFVYLHSHPDEMKQKSNIIYDFARKKLTWNQITKDILKVISDPIQTS